MRSLMKHVLLLGNHGAAAPVSPLLTNLVSYWSLEEASGTRADAHGSNALTDTNTVTQAVGKVGNAAEFVAANNEKLVCAKNDLVIGNGDATVWGWVYFTTLVEGSIAAVGNFNASADWGLRRSAGSTQFIFNAFDSGGTLFEYRSGVVPSAETWYFVAARFRASDGKVSFAVNSTITDYLAPVSGTLSGGIRNIGTTFYMGNYFLSHHNGLLDEVGFSKALATDDELVWLYNSGDGRSYAEIAALGN